MSSPDLPAPATVRGVAPALIYNRMAAVRAYENILQNASLDQLHALRIEFKKLRYAVEFFREVLGEESREVIQGLKKVQDHLGDLNDARVACQLISEFLAGWELKQELLPLSERRSPKPVVDYLAAKHAERHHLMQTFPKTWEAFNSLQFRKSLANAIAVI
nr:MAG: CHAD domain-containing protein [Chloroflexota bacterium]